MKTDAERIKEYEDFMWLVAYNLHKGLSKSLQKVQASAIREILEENGYAPIV